MTPFRFPIQFIFLFINLSPRGISMSLQNPIGSNLLFARMTNSTPQRINARSTIQDFSSNRERMLHFSPYFGDDMSTYQKLEVEGVEFEKISKDDDKIVRNDDNGLKNSDDLIEATTMSIIDVFKMDNNSNTSETKFCHPNTNNNVDTIDCHKNSTSSNVIEIRKVPTSIPINKKPLPPIKTSIVMTALMSNSSNRRQTLMKNRSSISVNKSNCSLLISKEEKVSESNTDLKSLRRDELKVDHNGKTLETILVKRIPINKTKDSQQIQFPIKNIQKNFSQNTFTQIPLDIFSKTPDYSFLIHPWSSLKKSFPKKNYIESSTYKIKSPILMTTVIGSLGLVLIFSIWSLILWISSSFLTLLYYPLHSNILSKREFPMGKIQNPLDHIQYPLFYSTSHHIYHHTLSKKKFSKLF